MAPIPMLRGRLPAGILDLLRPRDAQPQSQPQPAHHESPITSLAARLATAIQAPTRTTQSGATRALAARQDTTTSTVPGHYPALGSGPDPGTVVGIVLGSVGGFLLLLWLFYTIANFGGSDAESYGTASVVTRHNHSRSRSSRPQHRQHRHHHKSPRRETVEIRTTSRGPPDRGERVVVEETTRRSASRAPSVAPPPPRVVSEDDEVVVIEEHSPPRRHRSSKRRSSGAGGGSRRESGYYRDVDPDRYAGGDAPPRHVRSSSRR
ncbi:hypothetical protein NKR23_g8240 [Pleurostoma richardsiae]|uniref:Uncharacterized protein n=1 Tax=Pleurostoma richardsiae TaxID=41990 RepID=A0AA38R8K8_9PEZI|nr:hypothetical protein NKR23_g8240 [Pleurostoma richardsiae]